ncbi:hypothetical protein [Streptomyces sp. NPDC058268]|uniref:hypothetical protein n=1 Tax=Streptomyces sp. NPDC058268 TaxID=3346413 RepID=UPI0036F09E8A
MTSRTQAPASSPWNDVKHPAWLRLSARTGDWLTTVSGRGDVIAVVHPGAPTSDFAEFYPALAEGRFAPDRLLENEPNPEHIDPNNYRDRCAHPAFAGAVCHEAAHAKYTKLAPTRQHSKSVVHWATQLEEPRIEHRLVVERPGDRAWLRASARHVLLSGPSGGHDELSVQGAVHQAVLLLARAAGGVLDEDEVKPVTDQVTRVLGSAAVAELHTIFAELFDLEDEDQDGLFALGARVARIAQDDKDDKDDAEQNSNGGSGAGQSGGAGQEGSGQSPSTGGNGSSGSDASGGGSGQPDDAGDAPSDEAAIAVMMPCGAVTWGELEQPGADAEDGNGNDTDQDQQNKGTSSLAEQVLDEIAREAVSAAHAKIAVMRPPRPDTSGRKAAQQAGQQVFTGAGVGYRQITVRQAEPTEAQQRQSRALLNTLAKAQYREVHRTTRPVAAPPGRMVMREVVRREAQIQARTDITATPWQRISRRQVDAPPLTVGISLDVSYSMKRWVDTVASTGWALAHAVASPRLSGTVASVAWNGYNPTDISTALIAPGKRPTTVPVPDKNSSGGSDGCGQSLYALDGALNLTGTSGARAVVVITDGELPNTAEVQKAADHLTRSGVVLLWLSVDKKGWAPKGAHVEHLSDPDNFGPIVGRALATALSTS